jgi:predicted dehydrogenase
VTRRPLRLGVVGAGEVARRHVAAAASVAGVRFAGVTDVDGTRAAALAGPAGGRVYPDAEAMIGDVDVVVVATPHSTHTDLVLQAVRAGRHVVVEKPMATTVAGCDRMIEAARQAGAVLWPGQQQRHFSQVRAARDVLAGGTLGAALWYAERRSNDYRRDGSRPAWFFDPVVAGGGIAMLVGLHTFDRAAWVLGAVAVAVSGTTVTPDGWAIETDAAGTVWFDHGPPAHFTLTAEPAFHHETTVVCERGRVTIDPSGAAVTGPDGVTRRLVDVDPDAEYTASFARQYEALVRTVRDGAPAAITPQEGRTAVAVAEALYASARSGGARTPLA